MLKDFVTKRSALFNELMRTLSVKCMHACAPHAEVKIEGSDTNIPDMTTLEEQCYAKCEAKVTKINLTIEKHLEDSFNP